MSPRLKGNQERLASDAESIVNRLLTTSTTVTQIARQYHVATEAVCRLYAEHTTAQQRRQARIRKLSYTGKGRFPKGHAPWNKGVKGIRLSPATEFKPGCIRGRAARLYRGLGAITIRRDKPSRRLRGRNRKAGMPPWPRKKRRYIKIADDGRPQDRWIPYARYVYEQAHGPILGGMSVVHLDGDTMNDSLANLRAVPRRLLPTVARTLHPAMETNRIASVRRARKYNRRVRGCRRRAEQLRGDTELVWHCTACGHGEHKANAPSRCIKCGGGSFEQIKLQRTG